MRNKSVYDLDHDGVTNQLDSRTAGKSFIRGSRVTAEQGQAIRDVYFARLNEAGTLRQGGAFARPNFHWSPGPRLAAALGQAFAVRVPTEPQEKAIRALPVNDAGVESMIYLDHVAHVIYKKLKDFSENLINGSRTRAQARVLPRLGPAA